MSVSKSYTRAQWDAFIQALEELPEKPRGNQRVTVSDGMKEIRTKIRATQEKGYSLDEIVEEARRQGLEVGIGAVKYALYRPKKSAMNQKSAKDKGRAVASRSMNAGTKSSLGFDRLSKAASGQQGSGAIRGYQGFPIRPDTENL
ncbi:hypothetical protein G3N58_32325 [Paraburkholderia sp. Ac-20342]|uniref:hypothetical protein n=1 Tax=Paraburkholderia sp. Ac-20342 TaxID=2703889 RepID=UPI00197DB82B|nr:hypothetical protein [Paraburkholderia sp. Ac-20342]MBN3851464.1 hypothetical protein [Paraburkholderia sp. Ac-20342]